MEAARHVVAGGHVRHKNGWDLCFAEPEARMTSSIASNERSGTKVAELELATLWLQDSAVARVDFQQLLQDGYGPNMSKPRQLSI